jgi:hypothetical protein
MELESRDRANWNALLGRFCNRSYFRVRPVLVRPEAHVLLLRIGVMRRGITVAILLAFSVLMLLFPLIPPPNPQVAPPNVFPWGAWKEKIARVALPILGVCLFSAAARTMLRRDQVRFDASRGITRFRWGMAPLVRQVELPLARLRLQLYERGGNEVGFTALGIAWQDEVARLRLASAKWRTQLLPVFEQLSTVFGELAIDATQHVVGDASSLPPTVRTAIKTKIERGRSRTLCLAGETAVLRGSKVNAVGLLIIALFLVAFPFALDVAFGLVPLWTYAAVTGLAAVVAGAGLYMWPRTIALARHDWLRLPQCAADGPWPGQLHASDVAAVQLCSVRGEGEHIPVVNFKLSDYAACQVNLVSKGPATCRVNLLCDTDTLRAKEAAEAIAALLDVPVLDHRVRVLLHPDAYD